MYQQGVKSANCANFLGILAPSPRSPGEGVHQHLVHHFGYAYDVMVVFRKCYRIVRSSGLTKLSHHRQAADPHVVQRLWDPSQDPTPTLNSETTSFASAENISFMLWNEYHLLLYCRRILVYLSRAIREH